MPNFAMKICALCQKKSKLRKSHIIPEFLYTPIYDDEGRAQVIPRDSKAFGATVGAQEHLLCDKCEAKLSKFEAYTARLIREISSQEYEPPIFQIDSIDFDKFRLFQMSLLWRASVSSNAIFDQVKLDQFEESFRLGVLNEQPKLPIRFESFLWAFHDEPELEKVVVSPVTVEHPSAQGYRFHTANIIWHFFVSEQAIEHQISEFFIKEDQPLKGIWVSPKLAYQIKVDYGELINTAID